MEMKTFLKTFEDKINNFKYHGIYVFGYTNDMNQIKKGCYQPLKKEYENNPKYFKPIQLKKSKWQPNGIQINTTELSTIDIDEPNKCSILDKLLNDCKFYVKTRKGYHFYFNKENELARIRLCKIADINMDKLWFVPKYIHKDTKEEYNYELIKSEKLVDMPQYAIDWCKMLIDMNYTENNTTNKIKSSSNIEKLIIKPDLVIEKFNIKTMKSIYKIFFNAGFFDTYDKWIQVGYMARHLNNTDESYDLFDKFCRKVEGYENTPINNNIKAFYGKDEYNINFDENGILIKCSQLDREEYKKSLQHLYVSKYNNIINKFNKKFIYDEDDKTVGLFDEWMSNYKAICIKSPYGTGKTFAFRELIKKHQYKKVLFITYRQSLAHSFSLDLKNQFGFENYLDENVDVKKAHRIIIQLDSLKRLTDTVNLITQKDGLPHYDLVVLDEIEGLLSHLSFDKIEQYFIHNILTGILKKCSKILTLDGDLGDRTLDFITTLGFDYKIFENDYLGVKKHFKFSHNINTFDDKIDEDLNEGHKLVIVCMTKTESEKYYNKYNSKYKVCLHNSIEKNKIKLLDVNTEWAKCDLLIYSPSVESGVDFNIVNYFYRCYATVSNQSTSTRAFFQMLNRVRHYENNEITVLIPHNLPWIINGILCRFDEMKLNKWNNIEINNLTTILIHNDVERYNTKKHFMTCIVKTLLKKGHTYEYLHDKPEKKIKSDIVAQMKEAIISANDIDDEKFEKLISKQRRNKTITREENLKIQKFIYKKIFRVDTIDDAFMEAHYNKIDVLKNYKLINMKIDKREELKETDYLKKFKYNKCDNIIELINIFGFKVNNGKIEYIEDKKDITYKKIKNDIKKFIDNKKFKQLFESEQEIKTNNILKVAEDYLNNYGYKLSKKDIKIKEGDKFVNDRKIVVEVIKFIDYAFDRIKEDENKNIDNILFNDDEYNNIFNSPIINDFILKCKSEENYIIENKDIMEENEFEPEWDCIEEDTIPIHIKKIEFYKNDFNYGMHFDKDDIEKVEVRINKKKNYKLLDDAIILDF